MRVRVEGQRLVTKEVLGRLKRTIRRLKTSCPLRRDMLVSIEHMPGLHGQAWVTADGVALVRLDASKCRYCVADTLSHEWAHLMVPKATHGPAWGLAYSRCYRACQATT